MKKVFNSMWSYVSFAGFVFALASCVEPNSGTDNQIVVIGNGSDWAKTLVIDVAKSDHLESLVMTAKGLNPVSTRLQTEGAKATVACNSIQSACGAVGLPPLFLEWIAPSTEKKVILKADQVNQDAEIKEQQVYEAGASGTTRRSDLEDVPFSSKSRPLFISDGSVIFIDPSDSLNFRNSAHQTKWLASNVKELTSDGRQGVFYRVGEAWYSIGLSELMSTASLQANRQIFKSGILYQTDGDSIYAMSMVNDAVDHFRLKPQMLYEWNAQKKILSPVWKMAPIEHLIELDRSTMATGQNAFYAFAKLDADGGRVETKLLAWNSLGLQALPVSLHSTPREIVAGRDTLLEIERSSSGLVSAELCQAKAAAPMVLNGGSSFRTWTCDAIRALPDNLNQVVITDSDEIFFLGANSVLKLVKGPEMKFETVSGTQRSDLVGLRFLQIPSNTRVQ